MTKKSLALLRTLVFAAFVPALALSLVACEPENGSGGTGNGGEGDDAEDTTSEIAVTGLVDVLGCTYADISGYANLNLLPAGSGNPVIGVEVVEAKAESDDNAIRSTARSLIGNIFTVSFSGLTPSTEYKYRSFVIYGGITYYGDKYNTFTTKAVVGITSTGEVSEVKCRFAVLCAAVQTDGFDSRDNVYVGFAWSTSTSDICSDGNFESTMTSVQNVSDGVYSASLSGLSEGTTYYYASFTKVDDVYMLSSVKEFTTDKFEPVSVDLGLPSGLLWASCNVGATSPEEYGDYFAWGETEPKSDYSLSNSVTYGLSISELEYRDIIGADGNLIAAYDAATANWCGNWRMPTLDEMQELFDECTWEWTSVNGVNGRKVTGPNGNSIFLPAAGYRNGTSLYGAGSAGYYWAAMPYDISNRGYNLLFDSDYYSLIGLLLRYYGQSVRPVSD